MTNHNLRPNEASDQKVQEQIGVSFLQCLYQRHGLVAKCDLSLRDYFMHKQAQPSWDQLREAQFSSVQFTLRLVLLGKVSSEKLSSQIQFCLRLVLLRKT